MPYESIETVLASMRTWDVTHVLVKPLPDNDNAKNQIYFGRGYDLLNQLPFGELTLQTERGHKTIWASVDFRWLDDAGQAHRAPNAKLILYPQYPEVRLSGVNRGCPAAPAEHLQPVAARDRRTNNAPDRRHLIFGIAGTTIIGIVAPARSALAAELGGRIATNSLKRVGVFFEMSMPGGLEDGLNDLIARLTEIRQSNPHSGRRLSSGIVKPYGSKNAGGYTLEALLNINANSNAEPDFRGWEVKGYSKSVITLMTPEPDGGEYTSLQLRPFVAKYGYRNGDRWDFNGKHKAGIANPKTGLTLDVDGFDPQTALITDPAGGGLRLTGATGAVAMKWSFPDLITHWGRKHNRAVYVPFKLRSGAVEFDYNSPVLLGIGTDFSLFAAALSDGRIAYDPGIWARQVPIPGQTNQKKRSQFRVAKRYLSTLYKELREQPI